MSNNPSFYNKFRSNNATFQNNFRAQFVPPPPPPPLYFIPPTPPTEKFDQKYLKGFEYKLPIVPLKPIIVKPLSISEVKVKLQSVVSALNDLEVKEKMLLDNLNTLSEEEWNCLMKEIKQCQELINRTLAQVKGPYLDVLRKLLAKRAAKRLRLKRVRSEIKRAKEEKWKEAKERSRKIDENLQKIKDDIIEAQQEQESKLKADMVLKEVLRKKQDAKKCIVKLDALAKLRKARQNTAKGRGDAVSDGETSAFQTTIEKLKSLWDCKLSSYEIEESKLRTKLKEESAQQQSYTNVTEREVVNNMVKWKEVLFGGQLPQVDFHGDVAKFVAVRSHWDQYISHEGSTMPMGWVPPAKK